MTKGLSINQWAKEDRPREKMMAKGAASLSDAELLAILIGSGNASESAVDLMRRVMDRCENQLNRLGKMEMHELRSFKGIGEAKAITIMAACELGKRRQKEEVLERQKLDSSQAIYEFMLPIMKDLPHEECWIILLTPALKVIDTVCVGKGGWTSTMVDVRIIMREALLHRAALLVLCHNHPSGRTLPSREDDSLTHKVKQAADIMNIQLIDHVIVADGGFYSYNDEGRL